MLRARRRARGARGLQQGRARAALPHRRRTRGCARARPRDRVRARGGARDAAAGPRREPARHQHGLDSAAPRYGRDADAARSAARRASGPAPELVARSAAQRQRAERPAPLLAVAPRRAPSPPAPHGDRVASRVGRAGRKQRNMLVGSSLPCCMFATRGPHRPGSLLTHSLTRAMNRARNLQCFQWTQTSKDLYVTGDSRVPLRALSSRC